MALKVLNVPNFSGGLNTLFHQTLIAENESPNCLNVWATGGVLEKRFDYNGVQITGHWRVKSATASAFSCTSMGVSRIFASRADGTETLYGIYKIKCTGGPAWFGATSSALQYPMKTTNGTTWQNIGFSTGSVSLSTTDSTIVNSTSDFSGQSSCYTYHLFNVNNEPATNATFFKVIDRVSGTATFSDVFSMSLWEGSAAFTSATSFSISPTLNVSGQSSLSSIVSALSDFTVSPFEMNKGVHFPTHGRKANNSQTPTVRNLWVWDGTRMKTETTEASANPTEYTGDVLVHKGYVFAGNFATTSTADRSQVKWSALRDPTSFPGSNFVYVRPDDGDYVIKLVTYGGNLVIVKQRSAWVLIGEIFDPSNPTYSLTQLETPDDFLILYTDSIVVHNGILKMFGPFGEFQYIGGTSVIRKIEKIDPDLFGMKNLYPDFKNSGAGSQDAGSVVYKGNLILSIPTTANGKVDTKYINDFRGSWWKWDDSGKIDFRNNSFAFFKNKLYGNVIEIDTSLTDTSATAIGVTKFDAGNLYDVTLTGANVAIKSHWLSKEFNIGYGYFKDLYLYYKKQSGTLTVDIRIDQTAGVTSTANMNVGRGTIVRKIFPINQVGTTFQFGVSNSVTGENFNIFSADITYEQYPYDRKP